MAPSGYAFFFYGTLMDVEVFKIVIDKNHIFMRQEPGNLRNFKRLKVRGAHYPAIVRSIGDQVNGIFVDGITSEGKVCLDVFEDDDYVCERVSVELCDGREVRASAYIAGPGMSLEDQEWNFDYWKLKYRSAFLEKLKKGMKVY